MNNFPELLKDFIQPLFIVIGGIIALVQYFKQQKFKRMQNLSSLWKGFYSHDKNMALFTLMDKIESGEEHLIAELKATDAETKFYYLA